uniref:Uncharacterized immunity region protein 13 n=1 Tax=Bacillus phage phi105 TaxID=10717 RepID=YIMD_BPPH1|nr:RecName: Full=Uncharacterized immunity region protein 13 [Bacillus phage phi105]prf//1112178E ORF 13 [Bacillus phage phi105]
MGSPEKLRPSDFSKSFLISSIRFAMSFSSFELYSACSSLIRVSSPTMAET